MNGKSISPHRRAGRFAARAAVVLLLAYTATTIIRLLTLESPLEPIRDPWFTLMELLILALAPLLFVCMIDVDLDTPAEKRVYSRFALALMLISGILSLAGLAGVPTGNMQIRNIGIISYTVVTVFILILLARRFGEEPSPLLREP